MFLPSLALVLYVVWGVEINIQLAACQESETSPKSIISFDSSAALENIILGKKRVAHRRLPSFKFNIVLPHVFIDPDSIKVFLGIKIEHQLDEL